MDLKATIKSHLGAARLMQLATVKDGQPWVCTVYFVADEELNLYWLSWPERRHSQEIANNDRVAVTVPIKPDIPVIGVQAEGRAEVIKDEATVAKVMANYVKKYSSGKDFLKRFQAGTNHHQLYRFMPKKYVLFDESNNSVTDSQQELEL